MTTIRIPSELSSNPGKKLLLAYVSGPYRDPLNRGVAYVEANIRAAETVAQELWKLGFSVICPHTNTRHFDGIVPSDQFIAGDLRMIDGCDLLVMLPDWEKSEGAKTEREHARKLGIPAFNWPASKPGLERIAKWNVNTPSLMHAYLAGLAAANS